MKRILILVAISLFLCSTASASQGGGGESTKKKDAPQKRASGAKSVNNTPPGPSAAPAREEKARSPIPRPSPFKPVVDYANVVDADTRRKLESVYLNLKQRADIEFLVVTVDTTGEQDIFDYSLAVYRGWGIGSETNDSFLLLVAVRDRKYYTLVGSHLQGVLNDGLLGEIQRKYLLPEFKNGNYSQGIYNTVQAYVATLAQKRGFTIEGIDLVAVPNPQPTNSANTQSDSSGEKRLYRFSSDGCVVVEVHVGHVNFCPKGGEIIIIPPPSAKAWGDKPGTIQPLRDLPTGNYKICATDRGAWGVEVRN